MTAAHTGAAPADTHRPPFAALLRRWRTARKLSQLQLSLESDVSQRHLSFIESGRARPSRDMVLQLSEALDVPLRDRNLLLAAAGFAPIFRARALDEPEMQPIADAVAMMLHHQGVNPAVAVDGDWNVLMQNEAMQRLIGLLGDADALWARVCGEGPRNIMRLTIHRDGLRPYIANWHVLAPQLVARLRREVDASGRPVLRELLDEALANPEMPPSAQLFDPARPPPPVLPLSLAAGGMQLNLFTMISTFGTPQDITTDELRIESFFPADEASSQLLRLLAAKPPQ